MFDFLKRKTEAVKAEPVAEAIPAAKVLPSVPAAKGQIFFAENMGGMLPAFAFAKKGDGTDSKQLLKEQQEWLLQFGLISRPYPASSFILLRDRCPTLGAAIDCIANDVSSTGWQLSLKEGIKEGKGTDNEKKELEAFLNEPNAEASLKELVSSLVTDLQTVGDFSLEVGRSNDGKVRKIFHVPSHTIFRNKDRDRFLQKRKTKTMFFVPFKSNLTVDRKTGEEGDFDFSARANELIFKKLYNSQSSYYGRSPMLSCVGAVKASIACEEFNLYFFENRGVPNYVVVLSGEWGEGSVKKLATYMSKEMRGNENAHRTMVFQTPENGKAEFKPLENKEKEGSFRLYAQDLDDKILGVYKVPRCKVSIQRIGKLAGSDTLESLRNYNDSVVEPMQSIIEDLFNHKILPAVLGSDISFNLVLNNLHIDDFSAKAETYVNLIERGCSTPNEVRQRLSLGKEYAEGGKFYISSSLVEGGEAETAGMSKEEQEFIEEDL